MGKPAVTSGFALVFSNLWFTGINRGERSGTYWHARGEILRPCQDELKRRHSASIPSLIKNESVGIEDDQIPLGDNSELDMLKSSGMKYHCG